MNLMRPAVPLAVVATLGLAACGGDDSGDDSGDFIADADAICTDQAEQARDVALDQEVAPADEKSIATLYEGQLPILGDAQDGLEGLDVPDELSDDYDEFLSLRQQRIDATQDAVEAADQGEKEAFDVARQEGDLATTRSYEVGEQIGFGPCAYVLSEADTQAVEDAEAEFAESSDAEFVCKEYFLPQAARAFYGGVEDCLNDPQAVKKTVQEIQDVEGVDGVVARVTVQVTNGPYPGTYVDTLYHVDGAWRLYGSGTAPKRPPSSGKAT